MVGKSEQGERGFIPTSLMTFGFTLVLLLPPHPSHLSCGPALQRTCASQSAQPVSYTHLRAHETGAYL
eukprot:36812-Pyramimonas_sp.AAC.1